MAKRLTQGEKDSVLAIRHLPRRLVAERTGLSLGTVQKIISEADAPPPIVEGPDEPLPDPETLPADMPGDEVDRLRSMAARAQARAEREGNVAGVLSAGKLSLALLEHQRKAAPPPVVSIDDQPDMVAAAVRFRDTVGTLFERIVDEALKGGPQ
jgi:hypothetical protein